ncbi:unnamed protein product [Ambrosiozyma monospora]|uniref:Unnamed protein product n=1 Tax=Ambrosiozyma monospora TaxID=43982 RepID=A0A9W7DF05_AMBMO|nr:unnamed protein product [Ambrosiozyma monospora]
MQGSAYNFNQPYNQRNNNSRFTNSNSKKNSRQLTTVTQEKMQNTPLEIPNRKPKRRNNNFHHVGLFKSGTAIRIISGICPMARTMTRAPM